MENKIGKNINVDLELLEAILPLHNITPDKFMKILRVKDNRSLVDAYYRLCDKYKSKNKNLPVHISYPPNWLKKLLDIQQGHCGSLSNH